jgi:hypothetical protein
MMLELSVLKTLLRTFYHSDPLPYSKLSYYNSSMDNSQPPYIPPPSWTLEALLVNFSIHAACCARSNPPKNPIMSNVPPVYTEPKNIHVTIEFAEKLLTWINDLPEITSIQEKMDKVSRAGKDNVPIDTDTLKLPFRSLRAYKWMYGAFLQLEEVPSDHGPHCLQCRKMYPETQKNLGKLEKRLKELCGRILNLSELLTKDEKVLLQEVYNEFDKP